MEKSAAVYIILSVLIGVTTLSSIMAVRNITDGHHMGAFGRHHMVGEQYDCPDYQMHSLEECEAFYEECTEHSHEYYDAENGQYYDCPHF